MKHPHCAFCAHLEKLEQLRDTPLWLHLSKRLVEEDDPSLYGTDFDEMLDDPRRGQTEALNKLR